MMSAHDTTRTSATSKNMPHQHQLATSHHSNPAPNKSPLISLSPSALRLEIVQELIRLHHLQTSVTAPTLTPKSGALILHPKQRGQPARERQPTTPACSCPRPSASRTSSASSKSSKPKTSSSPWTLPRMPPKYPFRQEYYRTYDLYTYSIYYALRRSGYPFRSHRKILTHYHFPADEVERYVLIMSEERKTRRQVKVVKGAKLVEEAMTLEWHEGRFMDPDQSSWDSGAGGRDMMPGRRALAVRKLLRKLGDL